MSEMIHHLSKNSITESTLKEKEKEQNSPLPESIKPSEKPLKTTSSFFKMKSSESNLSSVKSGQILKLPSLLLSCLLLPVHMIVCLTATSHVPKKDFHLNSKVKDLDQKLTLLSKKLILAIFL